MKARVLLTVCLALVAQGVALPATATKAPIESVGALQSDELPVHIYLPTGLLGQWPESDPFQLEVLPAAIANSMPGQRCVFLVQAHENGAGADLPAPIAITATVTAGDVSVEPAALMPGEVGEVTVIPGMESEESTIRLTVTGDRAGESASTVASLYVFPKVEGIEELAVPAAEVRDAFAPWLAENHPELGITPDTEWTGTIVTPRILVVMHYLYFSDEWEMHVSWHVMIPPYDWARIELRRRFEETKPSLAFEISSRAAGDAPIPIDPSDEIWR